MEITPAPLLFRGKHRLTIVRAPEPSQVIWQNLELSFCARFGRQVGVLFLSLTLLAVCFLFIMLAQAYGEKFRGLVPKSSLCTSVLPAVAFGKTIDNTGAVANVGLNSSLPTLAGFFRNGSNPTCLASKASQLYWLEAASVHSSTSPSSNLPSSRISSPGSNNSCLNECVSDSLSASKRRHCTVPTTTPGVNVTFSTYDIATCFCLNTLKANILNQGLFSGISTSIQTQGDFCFGPGSNYLAFNALIIFASVVTTLVNQLLMNMFLERIGCVMFFHWI